MLTDEQIASHHRVRAGPVDVAAPVDPRHRLGARAPRHPHRHHRRGRAVRQRLPVLGHQPRRPPRLPRRPHRPRRLDGADGHHLDDLRHRPKGPEPSWEAVPGRTVLQDTGALVPGRRVRRAGRGPRRDVVRRRRRRSSPTQFVDRGLGRRSTRSPPRSARPAAAAGEFLEETGAFAAGEFQASTCSTPAASATRRSAKLRLPRLLPRAALRRRRGRPARADPDRARPGAARRPRSTRPASASTCTWSATSAPGASRRSCSRSASALIFLVAVLAAAPPRTHRVARQPQRSRHRPRSPVHQDARGEPDEPVPADRRAAGPRRRVRRDQLRRVAAARAAPAVGGQGGAVRVRHRAEP